MTGRNPDIPEHEPAPAPASPLGHKLMFLVFALGAFVLFAPIVVLPLIKDHCELLAEEARLQQVNADLQKEVDRQNALVDAFQKDATINERLAVLDLHYNNPAEETVRVVPPDFMVTPSQTPVEPKYQSVLKIPEAWPGRVRHWEKWAQDHGLINLFLDPTLTTVFLMMSAGLLIAAFVLFAPRVQPESTRVIHADTPHPRNKPTAADTHESLETAQTA